MSFFMMFLPFLRPCGRTETESSSGLGKKQKSRYLQRLFFALA
jgi:hypothetical protein